MYSIYLRTHILIVSCANVIVALGNLSIVTSVDVEVYNSGLKFQRDCTCTEIWMFNHGFPIVEDKVVLHNTKCMGKP